jgi:hypothetical protein
VNLKTFITLVTLGCCLGFYLTLSLKGDTSRGGKNSK